MQLEKGDYEMEIEAVKPCSYANGDLYHSYQVTCTLVFNYVGTEVGFCCRRPLAAGVQVMFC